MYFFIDSVSKNSHKYSDSTTPTYKIGVVESHYVLYDNDRRCNRYITVIRFKNREAKLIEEGSDPKLFLYNVGVSVKVNMNY
jgi:hypothetical protein